MGEMNTYSNRTNSWVIYNLLLLAIALCFIFNVLNLSYYMIAGVAILAFLSKDKGKLLIPKKDALPIVVVGCCVAFSFFLAEYKQIFTIGSFLVLIAIKILSESGTFYSETKRNRYDWFYYLLFAIIFFDLLNQRLRFLSLRTMDGNYMGVFAFLFFLYCNKRRHWVGVALSLAYTVLESQSRAHLLAMILFYVIFALRKLIVSRKQNEDEDGKKQLSFFWILLISLVATLILSYIWVFYISASGYTTLHRTSLNDSSNRIRFASNLYAFRSLNDVKQTLFWGYGTSIKEALGIIDGMALSTTQYLGRRIVQPHNSVLNILLRMGIIPGFIYCYFLGAFLNTMRKNNNIEYFIPYIVVACFMHSLFNLEWLLFWAVILMLPPADDGLNS